MAASLLATDRISRIDLCSGGGKIVLCLAKRIDAVERLSLLDSVTNFLEQSDARTFIDRRTRGSRKSIQLQAIDAGDNAIA